VVIVFKDLQKLVLHSQQQKENTRKESFLRLKVAVFLTYKQTKEWLPFLLQNELIKYDDKDHT
jgi:hypothetical protein